MTNHKFQNRENLKVIWFSDLGKKFFEKTKASKDYQYMGAFTEEEKEAEIAKLSEVKEKVSAPFKDEVVRTDAKEVDKKETKKKVKEKEVVIGEVENPDLQNDLKALKDGK